MSLSLCQGLGLSKHSTRWNAVFVTLFGWNLRDHFSWIKAGFGAYGKWAARARCGTRIPGQVSASSLDPDSFELAIGIAIGIAVENSPEGRHLFHLAESSTDIRELIDIASMMELAKIVIAIHVQDSLF